MGPELAVVALLFLPSSSAALVAHPVAPAVESPGDAPPDNGCGQTAFVLRDIGQRDTFTWVVNDRSIPEYLATGEAIRAMDQATLTVARADSPCLHAGNTDTTPTVFGGTTLRSANITPEAECFTSDESDGVSVVSFGPLPRDVVAVTCTYSEDGDIWQSDVLLSDAPGMFTLDPEAGCDDAFDLQSVMTHERGHSFGLGHVPEAEDSADLTMSAFMGRCDASARTLGYGDVLGLRQIY